jgi:cytochrome bd-type quinol oxidase subunit 2
MGAVSVATGYPLDTIRGAYRHFTDTGKLLKAGNSRLYLFPRDNLSQATYNSMGSLSQDGDNVSHANVIHIVMFIVGVACVAASIYYTAVFQQMVMHKFWAVVLSGVVVVFAALSHVIRAYTKDPKARSAIMGLWVMCLCYSVFTAIIEPPFPYVFPHLGSC